MTKHFPKISIIIGVLNMREFLPRTLDSVIRQNYPNLELIVMDGGSSDGTVDIIKSYEKYITIWKSEKDKGHADACNKAIKFATGDFISFLNADDFLGDNLLFKVAEIYQKSPNAKMISCGANIVKQFPNGTFKILRQYTQPTQLQITLENMLFGMPLINARFFHRSIFPEFGEFHPRDSDGKISFSNDREFLIRLALKHIQTEIIPEPLYNYQSHEGSFTFSNKNSARICEEHITLAKKLLNDSSLTVNQVTLIRQWLTQEMVYLFFTHIKNQNFKFALNTAKLGLQTSQEKWLCCLVQISFKKIIKMMRV